jgi:hypothetical protein
VVLLPNMLLSDDEYDVMLLESSDATNHGLNNLKDTDHFGVILDAVKTSEWKTFESTQ